MLHYDHFYKIFVKFWSLHKSFHPCKLKHQGNEINDNSECSAAIICDGHMKIRRRLCANSNVPLKLPIHFNPLFKELLVGCSHSPQVHGRICVECKDQEVSVPQVQRYTKKQEKSARRKLKALQKTLTNDMGSVR